MPYRNRLVRGLAILALLAGVFAGPAGRFLLSARASGLAPAAATATRPGSLPPGAAATKTPTPPPSPVSPGCRSTQAGVRSSSSSTGSGPLPDLAVSWMRMEPNHPSCYRPGDSMGLRVGISNLGAGRTGRFSVSANQRVQVVKGMRPNSTAILFIPDWSYTDRYACVTLDTTGAVRESNETNNWLGQYLVVPSAPPPCDSPSSTPPAQP